MRHSVQKNHKHMLALSKFVSNFKTTVQQLTFLAVT